MAASDRPPTPKANGQPVLDPPSAPPSAASADGKGPARGPILVVVHSDHSTLLGRRFALGPGPFLLGSGPGCHVVLRDDDVSPRHAHIEPRDEHWWCVDDGSTTGAYVNDARIVHEARLDDGDRLQIGATIFKFLSGRDVEARYHEEIYRMTIVDGLTQVHVKRYLLEVLEKETMRARRLVRDLSLILLDVDHFAQFNERHGPLAGDRLLTEVARVVQRGMRRDDTVARYDGDAFAVALPETDLDGARCRAEQLRETIAHARFSFGREPMAVTVSIGGSTLRHGDHLVARAETKLSEAKHAGRNCVRF